jgi:hypothetical protein
LTYCGFAANRISFATIQAVSRTTDAMQQPTTAGQIIDLAIAHDQARSGRRLTEYIRDVVAPIANLSARQIARMREYVGFPEDAAMTKLIKAIPSLAFLDSSSIFNRVLLPWENIQLDQSQLVVPSVITIFAGWKPPVGIVNRNIARSIAVNISAGSKYVFVYPHPSTYQDGEKESKVQVDQWINNLKSKVSGSWHQKIAEDNDGSNAPDSILEEVRSFTGQVEQSIKYLYTSQKTDLWFLLPSPYCIFYNIGLESKEASSRHGAFLVNGILLDHEHNVSSEGWLLTNQEQYERLEISFLKDVADWQEHIKDIH